MTTVYFTEMFHLQKLDYFLYILMFYVLCINHIKLFKNLL